MKKIQIAIADDLDEFRSAISRVINSQQDFEVVLNVKNGIDLLTQLERTASIDVILMDTMMPEMNGIDAFQRVRSMYPKVKIIALSQFDNDQNIIDMYIQGVKSFISKGDIDELFKAIRIVNGGGAYMTEQSLSIVRKNLKLPSKEPSTITLNRE